MAPSAELKQEDMFQSIGNQVNAVASSGTSGEAAEGGENFTVDEPQVVDNIGMFYAPSSVCSYPLIAVFDVQSRYA
jgi:hypothetical protein